MAKAKDQATQDQATQDQATQDQAGQDQAGQDQAGQDQAGQDQAGQDQAGQDQAGQDQAGQDQAGQDQAGQDQAGQDQAGQDQAGQDQAGQDQAGQDQAGQDQAGQDQAGQDQAGQDQAGQDQAGQDQAGQDQAGQDQAGQDQAGQDQAGQDQAGQDQAGQDQAGQDQAGQDQAGQDQAGQDQAGQDQQPAQSIAVKESFNFQALSLTEEESHEFITAIRENLGGESMTDRDLDRITLPAGGARQWEVPTAEGSEYQEFLEGIIIHQTNPRAYWKQSLDESGQKTPPDCSSPDGITGSGDIGIDDGHTRACNTCPFNEWGSADRGNGKACKEKKMLFLLRTGDILPVVVQVPSTSLAQVKKHMMRLASQRPPLRYYYTITEMGLEKVTGDPFDYARVTFRTAGEVPPDMRNQLEGYRDAVVNTISAVTVEQDE